MRAPWTEYVETLKRTFDGEFDTASFEQKTRAVRDVIRTSTLAVGVVALQPIPFLDSSLIVPIHAKMVRGIGRIRGFGPNEAVVDEMFKTLRGHLVSRHVTMGAAKLIPVVPFVGGLIAFSVAYALTCTIGELSDRYFRAGCIMSRTEMRLMFEVTYKKKFGQAYRLKRNDLRAMFRHDPEVRRQLEALRAALREGIVTDEEAATRGEEILRG